MEIRVERMEDVIAPNGFTQAVKDFCRGFADAFK